MNLRRPNVGRPTLAACALALAAVVPARPALPDTPGFDVTRDEIRRFIASAATDHGLDVDETTRLLTAARPQQSILDAMSRPAERVLSWWEYRERFLTEKRIADGTAFWLAHRASIERAAAAHGIPPEYLVAIVGVETSYGRLTGRYRILDALATLAFDYPARADYFRGELAEFLVLARDGQLDPLAAKGSYAGAMGAPQFMPSSVRRFAVDGNGDGRRDLHGSWDDVFASIANYFAAHGWRSGEPVLADAAGSAPTDDPSAVRLVLQDTVASLRARGYDFETTLPDDAPALLVPAERADGLHWRVGFQNFYVITRYNRSTRYGMAVHELARAVAARVASVPGS